MVKELKSVLGSPLSKLLFKVAFWVVSLVILRIKGLEFPYLALSFLLFFWIYFGNRSGRHEFKISFTAILFLSLGITSYLSSNPLFYLASSFLGVAMFLLISVNDLLVLNRRFFYRLTQCILFFFILLFFLSISNPEIFFVKYFILFVVLFLLFYEELSFLKPSEKSFIWRTMMTLGMGLIILEMVWVLSLLPLGLISLASLLFFASFIVWDLFVLFLENKNSWSRICTRVLSLALLTVIILLSTKWGI